MKTIISRLIFLLVISIALSGCAGEKSKPEEKVEAGATKSEQVKTSDELVQMTMARFEGVIELTEEQKAQITAIIKSQDPAVLNTDATARREMRQKMINEVFTPEQQQKWKEYMASKKDEAGH